MQRFCKSVVIIAVVLIGVAARSSTASAATQQLDCVLTDIGTQPGSENRPIPVVFDEAANTLSAQDDTRKLQFASVSISNVAISGATDNVSIGIDRSSLGVVWQRYGSTGAVTEYGKCRRSGKPATVAPN